MADRLEIPRREDFTFFHPLRVRWSEVERQDVHTELATKRPAPWPDAVVDAFVRYERVAPARS